MAKGNVISLLMHLLLLNITCMGICESRSPIFSASLPERCPSPPCECSADEFNRKRVTCAAGNLTSIPVDKMDKGIQVYIISIYSIDLSINPLYHSSYKIVLQSIPFIVNEVIVNTRL
jgi:hypothetical protein